MPRSNLRSAFALGLGSSVAAQQVFTNRVTEVAAFQAAVTHLDHTLETAAISPVVDRRAPRTNVLVYFGVGGIGKTTLSSELRRRFTADDSGPLRAAVHVDLAEPGAADLEAYLLRVRAGLGRLCRRWPAFDLAFSTYWERAHPGEPLREFVTRHSTLQRTAKAVGLPDQIASTVASVVMESLPGVAGATRKLGGMLYTQAKKAIVRHRALNKCELLAELIDSDADLDSLSYFPYLLAWDLAQAPAPRPQAVVFLDTFETISGETHREFERWIQRGIFLMPNVLFVITGRNRLDWADLESVHELDYVGTERWPYLHAGHVDADPRQHLVGYLSMTDADSYLETALTNNGAPAIPREIRNRIAAASGGLPLYLDLAVNEFLETLARDRTPQADDFGQPLASIVSRLVRDLDRDERELLRAAALVDAFDLDLLRAACPDVRDAVHRRFRDRPFLELDTDRVWPYSLHQILRDNIREADVDLRDSWSERERAAVAERIADHLGHVAAAAVADGDRGVEMAAFRMAIELSQVTGSFFDWTVAAAQRLLTSGTWDLPVRSGGADDAVDAMVTGLRGARERRAGNAERSLQLMNAALERAGLPPVLHTFLLLHRAHALRVSGRYSEAARDYAALAESTGEIPIEAVYWLTDYQFLDGRFADALAALEKLTRLSSRLTDEHLDGEVLRLRGHIHRVNGLFFDAENSYRHALSIATATQNAAAEGKALTDLVQTLAWQRPAEALEIASDARQINESIRNQVEMVKIHAATAVARCRSGEPDAAEAEIGRGLALTDACGYPGGVIWCLAARALVRLVGGDDNGYRRVVTKIASLTADLGGNRFWADIVRFWSDDAGAPGDDTASAQWIGGLESARERWHSAITQRIEGEAS